MSRIKPSKCCVWLLLLASCAAISGASSLRNNGDSAAAPRAVELLESMGVENLCHPTVDRPFLPRCSTQLRRRQRYPPDDDQRQQRYLQQDDDYQEYDKEEEPKSAWFDIWNTLGIVTCICVSAIAAGLTVSLMSLDPLVLLIKMRASENEKERRQAARLVTIVKKRHLLLISLILCQAVSSEALPIFLQDLMPRWTAVMVAVVIVVVFGEIVPIIFFTGPNQLAIASRWTPVIKFIMCLLSPIAAPLAKLLETKEEQPDAGNMYNRGELAALIRIQYEERMAFKRRKRKDLTQHCTLDTAANAHTPLATSLRALKNDFQRKFPEDETTGRVKHHHLHDAAQKENYPNDIHHSHNLSTMDSDELAMVEGALQMKTKFAMDIFCPMEKVFAIPSDMVLNEKGVVRIYGSAYSRIPVYERRRQDENDKSGIVGVFMTRQLIMVTPSAQLSVENLRMHVPFCVSPQMNLVDLVNMFQTGTSDGRGGHMALVCVRPDIGNEALDQGKAVPHEAILMGIITLEDVLEALLQDQIYDEMDAEIAEGKAVCCLDEVEVEDDGFVLWHDDKTDDDFEVPRRLYSA